MFLIGAAAAGGCKDPEPPPPPLRIDLVPNDGWVFKIEDEIGFEGWHFGLRFTGPAPGPVLDELAFTYLSGAKGVAATVLLQPALEAHVDAANTSTGTLAFRNFDVRLPAELKVNAMRVTARYKGRPAGMRMFPVVRYGQHGRYRLPVSGCWLVSSGHAFGLEHRRWYNKSHFGWDLVMVDAEGDPKGDGNRLVDYYGFSQPVVAPADGRVVLAEDRHGDNPPGQIGARGAANYVLLDTGGNEHVKLAHLMKGSLLVKTGDSVEQGQPLARVGNSGMSDAPHLHVHFQRVQFDEDGTIVGESPLPLRFSDYQVTSNAGVRVPVDMGRPRRGEFVCAR